MSTPGTTHCTALLAATMVVVGALQAGSPAPPPGGVGDGQEGVGAEGTGETTGAGGAGGTGGAVSPPAQSSDGFLLLVYAEPLQAAAEAWAEHRRDGGWTVQRHVVREAKDLEAARGALLRTIRAAYAQRQRKWPFAVLLLGDADLQGIPTWHFPQNDPLLRTARDDTYASDHPYQRMDDADELPDIALGRVPARTTDEAFAVLSKIKRYESAPAGPWRRRIVYAAGEGRFGLADQLLESLFKTMVDRLVPDTFDLSMTYAKADSIYCPPPSKLTQVSLARLGEAALLYNYVGHGHPRGFDSLLWRGERIPMLNVPDLAQLPEGSGRLPIALHSCCNTGWYDLPEGRHSLAEAMLFHPGGPVSIIAGSRVTHPYASVILQNDIARLLLVKRVTTVGELDLRAMRSMLQSDAIDREIDLLTYPIARAGRWKSSLPELRRMHVKLFNLLGDPTTRIALPTDRPLELAIEDGTLVAHITDMAAGEATIILKTARTSLAEPDRLMVVNGPNDPDLEVKAAHNYPLANERVLDRVRAEVRDGGFSLSLESILVPEARVIQVLAEGTDAEGRAFRAIGAMRLP